MLAETSAVEKDFDRLARLDDEGWTHNNHYHHLLLRHVPETCGRALDVGCGTGAFSRRLAARAKSVVALDLSSEMIRVAQSRSSQFSNIEFQAGDAMVCDFPSEHFDCIATIATLHHLPLPEVLTKLKAALKPGGILIIVDLFEPERDLFKLEGLRDLLAHITACAVSGTLRLWHNGRLKPPREVRAAWEEHGKTDSYLTMSEARDLYAPLFPGAMIRRHLLWRYSVVWQKPAASSAN
jgi:ubiquinone/menaquinone biosynthesis C-methylase UbiE